MATDPGTELRSPRRGGQLRPIFLCAILIAGALTHPVRVAAQHPSLDLGRLRQGVDSMSIAIVRGNDTTPVGQLWDEIRFFNGPDGAQLRRVYWTINEAFGPTLDSTFSMAPDLKPIRRWSSGRFASDSIVYRGDSASGWADGPSPPRRVVARQVPVGIIDPSSFDLVVRTAELSPDYVLSVRSYLAWQDSVVTLTARVLSTEPIRQRDGAVVDCWKVEGDFDNLRVIMWVDKVTRALVQETIHLTPDIAMYMLR